MWWWWRQQRLLLLLLLLLLFHDEFSGYFAVWIITKYQKSVSGIA
jgi:hypothetical protein